MAEPQFVFHSISRSGRDSVRDPIPPPMLRLVRLSSSKLVEVPVTEAQLYKIIENAAVTLDRMRQSRQCDKEEGRNG